MFISNKKLSIFALKSQDTCPMDRGFKVGWKSEVCIAGEREENAAHSCFKFSLLGFLYPFPLSLFDCSPSCLSRFHSGGFSQHSHLLLPEIPLLLHDLNIFTLSQCTATTCFSGVNKRVSAILHFRGATCIQVWCLWLTTCSKAQNPPSLDLGACESCGDREEGRVRIPKSQLYGRPRWKLPLRCSHSLLTVSPAVQADSNFRGAFC